MHEGRTKELAAHRALGGARQSLAATKHETLSAERARLSSDLQRLPPFPPNETNEEPLGLCPSDFMRE